MSKIFAINLLLLFLSASFAFGQNLEAILKNANAQTVVYAEGFKDLIATETKTFERYKKDGAIDKRNVIESNFIVYQSKRDDSIISEYRNVKSVDGKSVSDKSKTPDEFFAEVQKTNSTEKELEKIQKESLRYDKTLEIQGLTLLQAPVLSDNFRPFFEYELLGNETIDGNEVFLISYKQTRKSPFILINEKNKTKQLSLGYELELPDSLKKNDIFLSGKLWIDANNFQLRREERILASQGANPFILMKTDFEYQTSVYGFLVPKQITLVQYNTKTLNKNSFAEIKNLQVKFDYSTFTKTKVEVELLDDDETPENL